MCTAITLTAKNFYFGRNLDWKDNCGGTVVVCPKNFTFRFQNGSEIKQHYAIIGVAAVAENYPLYFDGCNEAGLAIAGLNFPQYAVYHSYDSSKNNLAPYELIPWLLCNCRNLAEARKELENISIWNQPFSDALPLSPLHWLIADQSSSITVESTKEGLQIYENPYGILTNSPPFPYHDMHVNQYLGLSNQNPTNRFSDQLMLHPYSFGMGAIGLPGDLSSSSRFVRAAFTKWNSPIPAIDTDAIIQFFRILASVSQSKGVNKFPDGDYEYTVYSSCCDATEGIYYYTTYEDHSIRGIDMHKCDLKSKALVEYPLTTAASVCIEN